MVLSTATLVACGSSSDDQASKAKEPTANVAKTTASAAAPSTTEPATQPPNVPDPKRTAQGTGRLSAVRLGTPGRVVVEPEGAVPGPGTEHWYKLGTRVTVHAKDTPTARFSGWAGDARCNAHSRVCRVKVSQPASIVVAGFNLVRSKAKGLKKSDPRLKVVVGD